MLTFGIVKMSAQGKCFSLGDINSLKLSGLVSWFMSLFKVQNKGRVYVIFAPSGLRSSTWKTKKFNYSSLLFFFNEQPLNNFQKCLQAQHHTMTTAKQPQQQFTSKD